MRLMRPGGLIIHQRRPVTAEEDVLCVVLWRIVRGTVTVTYSAEVVTVMYCVGVVKCDIYYGGRTLCDVWSRKVVTCWGQAGEETPPFLSFIHTLHLISCRYIDCVCHLHIYNINSSSMIWVFFSEIAFVKMIGPLILFIFRLFSITYHRMLG